MKKLEMTDHFDCTPEEYWDVFFDPAFTARLDAEIGFKGREELAFEDDGETIHTRSRVTPKGELPPHVEQMFTNGLKMLRQVMDSGTDTSELPEPMRKMIRWGKSTFKDLLKRDSGKASAPPTPKLDLRYIEDGVFSRTEGILRWTIELELFKDISSFAGTITCEPDDTGCVRHLQGEFSLAIPGAGEKVEAFLVEEVAKGHRKAVELTRQVLKERRGAKTN